MKVPFLIGRLIFGGYFLQAGIHHFMDHKEMSQYAAMKKVPMPEVAVAASGAALVFGGASLLLGIKPKWGAMTLMGFLAGVSPIMHNFWAIEDPQQRMNDMINFTKNLALLGGALALLAVDEPWPASVPVAQPSAREQVMQIVRRGTERVAA